MNASDQSFRQWIREVDLILLRAVGLTSDDLADQPYRDMWEDGLTAMEAAERALEDEGFYLISVR